MLFELAFFGALWLWLPLTLVFFGVMAFFVERDNPIGAALVFILTLAGLQYLTDFKPFTVIYNDPTALLGYFAVYLGAGIFYGGVKWALFLKDTLKQYKAKKAEYLASAKLVEAEMDYSQLLDMTRELAYKILGSSKLTILPSPRIGEHKSRVTTWMMFWPVSFIWTAIDDLIIGVWNWAYEKVADLLQAISDRIFASVKGDVAALDAAKAKFEAEMKAKNEEIRSGARGATRVSG